MARKQFIKKITEAGKKLEKQYENLVGEDGFKTDVKLEVDNSIYIKVGATIVLGAIAFFGIKYYYSNK